MHIGWPCHLGSSKYARNREIDLLLKMLTMLFPSSKGSSRIHINGSLVRTLAGQEEGQTGGMRAELRHLILFKLVSVCSPKRPF